MMKTIHAYTLLALGLALSLGILWISAGSAQDAAAPIRLVRTMQASEIGLTNPAGLAFSFKADTFHMVQSPEPDSPSPSDTQILNLASFAGTFDSARIAIPVEDPINMVFDDQAGRLLLYQPSVSHLVQIPAGAFGDLDAQALVFSDVRRFGLKNAQGMAIDPASGRLFFLDAVGPRLVWVDPGPEGRFDRAAVHAIGLQRLGLKDVRGLAFDPSSGHLHLVSLADQRLYEITPAGKVVAWRDLSEFNLSDPQGMVFAPSGDQTDDPGQMSLYLVDAGKPSQAGLPGSFREGRIVELSFVQPPSVEASMLVSHLVQTIDTSIWTPPSPDPAGITYLPGKNRLLVSDCEVDEMTIFTGVNMFEMDLAGHLVDTWSTMAFSEEPTDVDRNPSNGHLFLSDDTGQKSVYELDPGADGKFGTPDDVVSRINTNAFGSGDPEGVAYASNLDALFISDGENNEVYKLTPGLNGIFDGPPPEGDDVLASFDTFNFGLENPESIVYNPDTGHLYLGGSSPTIGTGLYDRLFEVTTDGDLVSLIDVSEANARKLSGLSLGRSSLDPTKKSIYIASRGVDNNFDPNENDGKVYEMGMPTLPPPATATPTATNTPTRTSTPTETLTPIATKGPAPTDTPTVTPPPNTFPDPSGSIYLPLVMQVPGAK